jgi:diguanylate cyclase (GGDEF)-like protein/hemerythrin-like metal-binding protein
MYKKLEIRMIITVFILVMLFFSRQIVKTVLMSDYEDMSSTINMAGKQRMLSQKITKDVAMLRGEKVMDQRDYYVVELNRTLEQFQENHEELLAKNNSEAIKSMYVDLEPIMTKLVYNAQEVARNAGSQDPNSLEILTQARLVVLQNDDNFLVKMDEIVNQYAWESKQAFAWIEKVERVFFLVQLMMIIIVTTFIFIPAHNTFKAMYIEAEENNTNMIRLFRIMRNALFLLDENGAIRICNKKAEHLLKQLELDPSISHVSELFQKSSEDWSNIKNKLVDGDKNLMHEVTFEQEESIVMEMSLAKGVYQGKSSILLNLYDITVQKKVEETLTSLVIKDKLTGLYNRYHLENVIDRDIEQSERYEIPLSMIILDLDHFKKINDRWGHPVGDQVLKKTADILLDCVRKADSIFRIGGEEFVIMLSHTNSNGAIKVAENVRITIEKAMHPIVGKYTASFGVAERKAGETYRNLYQRADQALYLAKNSGRNCVKESIDEIATTSLALHWKKSWNSGEAIIDDQHKTLFRLANELLNMSYEGPDKEGFMTKLDAIIEHIERHFEYEEKVLEKIEYREQQRHLKIHVDLLKRGRHLRILVETEEVTLQNLVHYIFDDVIIGHLLREDVLYFPYIN